MARSPIWPPKRRVHKTGQEYICFKKHTYYLGQPGSAEADEKYRALLLQLAPAASIGLPVPPDLADLTVEDVVSRWIVEEIPRYPRSSREPAQFRYSLVPLLELFGTTLAKNFRAGQLEQVQMAMAKTLIRPVVNRRIVRIRTVWRWVEQKGLVPPGSWENLRTLRGLSAWDARVRQPAKRLAITEADITRIANAAPAVVRAMIWTQYLTGMRSGEVRTARVGEIDRLGDIWIYRPANHKMAYRGQSRAIPIGPRAQELLKPYLLRPSEEYVFHPVLEARRGNVCYSDTSYAQACRRAALSCDIIGFHPYLLRHAAKQHLTELYGLDTARAVLGQLSLGTTNLYGSAVDLRVAINAIQKSG